VESSIEGISAGTMANILKVHEQNTTQELAREDGLVAGSPGS